jgi:hypothetical protein
LIVDFVARAGAGIGITSCEHATTNRARRGASTAECLKASQSVIVHTLRIIQTITVHLRPRTTRSQPSSTGRQAAQDRERTRTPRSIPAQQRGNQQANRPNPRPICPRPAPTYTVPGRQNKHPCNARLADSRTQVAERHICYDQTMGLIRKLGSGILATVMAVRLPHEALEAVEPVHSRAPEPPHIHPELHEPADGIPCEAGVLGGGSPRDLEVRVGDQISLSEALKLQVLEHVFGAF